jgi:hypothetical protein
MGGGSGNGRDIGTTGKEAKVGGGLEKVKGWKGEKEREEDELAVARLHATGKQNRMQGTIPRGGGEKGWTQIVRVEGGDRKRGAL